MLGPLNVNLEQFGLSSRHGFLPDQFPLRQLPLYYEPWELVAHSLPALIRAQTVRERIDRLPALSTDSLNSERQWQRAYVLLSFMTHAYIWGGSHPAEILPPSISMPMLEVSSHLGLPPVATYAGLVLWNYAPINSNEPLNLENIASLHTFTGTVDEAWFYLISVSMEARGGEIIPAVMRAMDAVRTNDAGVVRDCLLTFAESIHDIGVLLERMYEKCEPDVFYHQIRPFLAGSKNMGHAGLPRGVFYDEGYGKGEWRQSSGGSNAQSSLIQFFDVILGVEHNATGNARGTAPGKHGFLEEMRNYMPGPHRKFLQHLDRISNIREYITTSACNSDVTQAYNLAVDNLSDFRSKHIKIVTRYIINPSKKLPSTMNGGLNLAVASTEAGKDGREKKLHGTGGTELLPFLKQSRDETKETTVQEV